MHSSHSKFRVALHWVCRLLLSATFIFSGFVKVADPMGMAHKLYAYCVALNIPVGDSSLLLQVAASGFGILEFVLGTYLLLGVSRAFTTRLTLGLTTILTILTLWVWLDNPVSDCGCFGEALTLSHGESLAKNIILLLTSSYLVRHPRKIKRLISERNAWVISMYAWVYAITLCLYTLHYLPIVDFTAYKVGTDIRAAFVGGLDEKSTARLANFYLADRETGDDQTFAILEDSGYTFLLTIPSTQRADDGCSDRINDIYDVCNDKGYAFYLATASDEAGVIDWADRTGAAYPALLAEDTELKAMVRSNPGLLLLKDGILVAKWGNNNLPNPDASGTDAEKWIPHHSVSPLLRLILWFVIPLLLIIGADSLGIGILLYKRNKYIKKYINLKKTQDKMRKKIVAGNWKMNKNLQEGVALAQELNEVLTADKPNCDVVICTPFIHLASVAAVIDQTIIGLGAENCANKEKGAYTGEVSAEMVKSTGAGYVILGHSERRAYYNETAEILKEKVNLALANGLKVIFCIGEVLEEREAGKQNEVVAAQLAGSLYDLTAEQFSQIILAYEPVWAIGTGKTATADQAQDMHAFIRATIAQKFGDEAAENVSILYGGSCKPSNAKEIFSKVDVDGGLIGGASLKVADFKGIIDAWKA